MDNFKGVIPKFVPPNVDGYVKYSNFGDDRTVEEITIATANRLSIPVEDVLVKEFTPGAGIAYAAYVKDVHLDKVNAFHQKVNDMFDHAFDSLLSTIIEESEVDNDRPYVVH